MFWYCLRGIGKQTRCTDNLDGQRRRTHTHTRSMNHENGGTKEIYMHLLLSFCVRYILDRLVRSVCFECMHNVLRTINLCIGCAGMLVFLCMSECVRCACMRKRMPYHFVLYSKMQLKPTGNIHSSILCILVFLLILKCNFRLWSQTEGEHTFSRRQRYF